MASFLLWLIPYLFLPDCEGVGSLGDFGFDLKPELRLQLPNSVFLLLLGLLLLVLFHLLPLPAPGHEFVVDSLLDLRHGVLEDVLHGHPLVGPHVHDRHSLHLPQRPPQLQVLRADDVAVGIAAAHLRQNALVSSVLERVAAVDDLAQPRLLQHQPEVAPQQLQLPEGAVGDFEAGVALGEEADPAGDVDAVLEEEGHEVAVEEEQVGVVEVVGEAEEVDDLLHLLKVHPVILRLLQCSMGGKSVGVGGTNQRLTGFQEQYNIFQGLEQLPLIIFTLQTMAQVAQGFPFQFTSLRQAPPASPTLPCRQWPKPDMIKYAAFLQFLRVHSKNRSECPDWSFYRRLSLFLQTKNANQCRIHHQRMSKEHPEPSALLASLKQGIDHFQEWYQHYQPILVNMQHCLSREQAEEAEKPSPAKEDYHVEVTVPAVKKDEDLKPTDTDYLEEKAPIAQPRKRQAGFTSFIDDENHQGLVAFDFKSTKKASEVTLMSKSMTPLEGVRAREGKMWPDYQQSFLGSLQRDWQSMKDAQQQP